MRYFLVVFLMIFLADAVSAQQNSASNIDAYRYNFGFIVGYNSNTFRVQRKPGFRDPDSLQAIVPESLSGFNLGVISSLKLTKNLDLRFTPTLAFVVRQLNYQYINSGMDNFKQVESTYVDLPLSLKLKSVRLRNVRVFLIGGIKPGVDVISQKKFDDSALDEADKKVKLKRINNSWEVGFGLDLYYQYFKMSPELKISRGFTNLLRREDNRYSRPLDGLFTELFQINFCFE